MKIMVFDVPAASGGALTILKQYHEKALQDKVNQWFFVVSTPSLKESENVKVIKYPWIKKSWIHRLYFDNFIANRIVAKYEVDQIISLQNVIIPNVKVKQVLYLHQPLPFVEKKYKIYEDIKFWIYQNIIGKMIYKSIRSADKVIVQTKWIQESAIKKAKVSADKFEIIKPEVDIEIKREYCQDDNQPIRFFYPASGYPYKNHEVIVYACRELKLHNYNNYLVTFTINGDESSKLSALKEIVVDEQLPIEFVGNIDSDKVFDLYSKSILLFPSYIETFGLPLLEARMHYCPIIASDCSFSKEVLENYNFVQYFNPYDHSELFRLMSKFLNEHEM
jgi:glycosyltransferase involved in cell wall biosynthesis